MIAKIELQCVYISSLLAEQDTFYHLFRELTLQHEVMHMFLSPGELQFSSNHSYH